MLCLGRLGERGQTLLAYWIQARVKDSVEHQSGLATMRGEAGVVWGLQLEIKHEANQRKAKAGVCWIQPRLKPAVSATCTTKTPFLFSVPRNQES